MIEVENKKNHYFIGILGYFYRYLARLFGANSTLPVTWAQCGGKYNAFNSF
tara:strand:+ start:898 stop:1050 length:153 start_codon:yes stop_codon:yes gene_type:complete